MFGCQRSKSIIFSRLLALLVASGTLQSCHWIFRSHAKSFPGDVQAGVRPFASDSAELKDIQDFYRRVFGGPDDDYSVEWEFLDRFRSGGVAANRIPYRDSWYPEANGGTNVNGALSRYDQAFGGGASPAAAWEAEFNSRQTPSWYGHCNGTSVAAVQYLNPQRSVSRPRGCEADANVNCVIFTPSEIRALLTEISMNARAKFISGNRCRLSQEELNARPAVRTNPLEMDACDDVNPASFHAGLINFLGRKQQPLIFDYNKDEEVWNYPVYGYTYTPEGPLNEQQALERLGLGLNEWIFNPKAVSWYYITMGVTYRRAPSGFDGAGTTPAGDRVNYTYILELDENGRIVGGEWTGNSRMNHPDFLWMAFEPSEPTGSASRGNPNVSNEQVQSIWAESVGLDPDNPFRDPNNPYDFRYYPSSDIQWGEVKGYYRVILDGRSTGSVFLGKKTHMRLLVSEALEEGASVDLFLNGKSLGRKTPQDGKLDIVFDSTAGINYLNVQWDSEKISSSKLDWEFRFFAM